MCTSGYSLLMTQANLSHIPSASLLLHTRCTVTLAHSTSDAVQISVVIFMRCHAAPEVQWVGRKPVVVNRPGFLRMADLSKLPELFTSYILQTARRIKSFAASDSDLVGSRI